MCCFVNYCEKRSYNKMQAIILLLIVNGCLGQLNAVPQPVQDETRDPCVPSPCGAFAICRNIGGQAACSCSLKYIGRPPNCRPECVTNQDCVSSLACINEKCKDPCLGSCGQNARCLVMNHLAICTCFKNYKGDPFTACVIEPTHDSPPDLCNPSPCGSNAQCENGACSCLLEYHGDPYVGCIPECTVSTDCERNQICVRKKCMNPCPDTCGANAVCEVFNHIPMCSCPAGYTGNSFVSCNVIQEKTQTSWGDSMTSSSTVIESESTLVKVLDKRHNQTKIQSANTNYITIVTTGVLSAVALIVIIVIIAMIINKRRPPRTQESRPAARSDPFYLNMLFRNECDREIQELEEHKYEEVKEHLYDEVK